MILQAAAPQAMPLGMGGIGNQPFQLPPGAQGVVIVQIIRIGGDAPMGLPAGQQATVGLPPMAGGMGGFGGPPAMGGFGGIDLRAILQQLLGQGRIVRRPTPMAQPPREIRQNLMPVQQVPIFGGFGGPARAAAPAGPMDRQAEMKKLVKLVNAERAKVGAPPVTLDEGLNGVAQKHSEDMVKRNYFSHTSPDGKSPWQRAGEAGVGAHAENIAAGQADAEGAMHSWMNSAGHKANILNPGFTRMGGGVQDGKWTQMFA